MNEIQVTTEDIKKSVEYRYHLRAIKRVLLLGVVAGLIFCLPSAIGLLIDLGFSDSWWRILLLLLVSPCFWSIPTGIIAWVTHAKARSLLKQRDRLIPCVVQLENPAFAHHTAGISYYFFHAVVQVGETSYNARTGALFTDGRLGSGNPAEEYKYRDVLALFDEKTKRIYVMRKV